MFPSLSTWAERVDLTKSGNPAEAVKAVRLSCFFKILPYQHHFLPAVQFCTSLSRSVDVGNLKPLEIQQQDIQPQKFLPSLPDSLALQRPPITQSALDD